MDVKNEIKSLLAKKGTTLRAVCEMLSVEKNKKILDNNLTNKFRRKTIKFEEVQDILKMINYHIEFVENNQ